MTVPGRRLTARLSLLLIPALAGSADEDLAAAVGGVMDVPVVAAARLKGHVGQEGRTFARCCQRVQKGIADKILCKSCIRLTGSEYVGLFKVFFVENLHNNLLLKPL